MGNYYPIETVPITLKGMCECIWTETCPESKLTLYVSETIPLIKVCANSTVQTYGSSASHALLRLAWPKSAYP